MKGKIPHKSSVCCKLSETNEMNYNNCSVWQGEYFFTLIILNFKIRSKGVKHYYSSCSYIENCTEIQFIVTYVPGCFHIGNS